MAFQRGDVVLIPFPYTDLTATKTHPAVVVSGDLYHRHRSELLLAYISSQMNKANVLLDYSLADWQKAGLPKPSFVRPKMAAIEPALVGHQVGKLSMRDMIEVDRCLRRALALTETILADLITDIDWMAQPVQIVQMVGEKVVSTLTIFVEQNKPGANIESLQRILKT
jgi:mRNA interferase MazF